MLGTLEGDVVAVLQEIREGTTRQILEAVNRRGRHVAYTTVSTILMRLHAKGVIDRRSEPYKGGERYVYTYRDIEDAYIDTMLRRFVGVFGNPGMVHLAERIGSLNEDDVRRLRERLRV